MLLPVISATQLYFCDERGKNKNEADAQTHRLHNDVCKLSNGCNQLETMLKQS